METNSYHDTIQDLSPEQMSGLSEINNVEELKGWLIAQQDGLTNTDGELFTRADLADGIMDAVELGDLKYVTRTAGLRDTVERLNIEGQLSNYEEVKSTFIDFKHEKFWPKDELGLINSPKELRGWLAAQVHGVKSGDRVIDRNTLVMNINDAVEAADTGGAGNFDVFRLITRSNGLRDRVVSMYEAGKFSNPLWTFDEINDANKADSNEDYFNKVTDPIEEDFLIDGVPTTEELRTGKAKPEFDELFKRYLNDPRVDGVIQNQGADADKDREAIALILGTVDEMRKMNLSDKEIYRKLQKSFHSDVSGSSQTELAGKYLSRVWDKKTAKLGV